VGGEGEVGIAERKEGGQGGWSGRVVEVEADVRPLDAERTNDRRTKSRQVR
jgi:hypothetical protein